MKRIALAVAVLFVASLIQAQTQPMAKPADPKTAPVTKSADNKGAKKEALPKIPGVEVARPNGTFMGLEVVGGNFKLTFYDKKKKAMPVDVTRATARWPNTHSATVAFNFSVLNPSGGTALVGAKAVRPPFAWNVFITLLQGDGDAAKAVESYTVPFHG